jgi:pimeloyl-ACP methyl ester carboxylesterase
VSVVQNPRRLTARSRLALVLVLATGLAALFTFTSSAPSGAHQPKPTTKPTVVLVHGAFADASGWASVVERLQRRGYEVIAPPNPLRGVSADAAYIKSILATVKGPIVLVGHSYGGMVITNAAYGDPNVKALVYIAAFAPDRGDTVQSLSAMAPGGMLGPDTLTFRQVPGAVEAHITPSVFHEVFAADVSRSDAAVMAASQRPASLVTLGEPSGPPAWKTIPSWYMVASQDNAIGAANERLMAKHIGATTVEVKASHVPMITHPHEVTDLVLDAARTSD